MIFILIQIVVIYFLSRLTISTLFHVIRILIRNDKAAFGFISLIFLPGTLVHEAAHFLAALFLFLKVRRMNIFPEFGGNYIKLGSVEYEKQDAVRGILVGIAPVIMGIVILGLISQFSLNASTAYLIFSISSTMFSSRRDLQDFLAAIPISILIAGIIYVFNIRLDVIYNEGLIRVINTYLFASLVINAGIIIVLKCLNLLLNR